MSCDLSRVHGLPFTYHTYHHHSGSDNRPHHSGSDTRPHYGSNNHHHLCSTSHYGSDARHHSSCTSHHHSGSDTRPHHYLLLSWDVVSCSHIFNYRGAHRRNFR